MPKTKFQELIFSIIMVFVMVYCMTLYNISLNEGLTYNTFIYALKSMWIELVIAFVLQKLIGGPIAKKLAFKHFNLTQDKPIFITIFISIFTVCIMAPLMTLIVSIMHTGFSKYIITLWLPRLIINFPFALMLQLFFAGPLVRYIFRKIFKEKNKTNDFKLITQ